MDPEAVRAEVVGVSDAVVPVSPSQLYAGLEQLPPALEAAAALAAAVTAASVHAVSALPPLAVTADNNFTSARRDCLQRGEQLDQ